jgi:NTE family protein
MRSIFARFRLGLVLGGGGARGGAHAGVLSILSDIGYQPDLIVGASMGALIASLAGTGLPPSKIIQILLEARFTDLISVDRTGRGLVGSDRIESFLKRHLGGADLRDLKPKVAVMATDLLGREAVILDEGPAVRAVLASMAIPGLFPLVEWGGRELVDGGLLTNVPTQAAYQLGAERLVAVDVGGGNWATDVTLNNIGNFNAQLQRALYWLLSLSKREAAFETWLRSAMLTNDKLSEYHLQLFPPDILIQPAMPKIGLFTMEFLEDAIRAGVEAALALAPEICKLANRWYHLRQPATPAGRLALLPSKQLSD